MKNYLKLFLLFVTILMGYGGLSAQGARVTGTVKDAATGETLTGVNIALKGSSTVGTVSDADGNFSITLPESNKGNVLQFSYLGYLTQSVSVQGKTVIDVRLVQDTKALSEVVVTAYGSAKKAMLPTAQIGVTEKQLNETVNTTLEQAIQGRAAGVYITQNSGQPGGAISVNIRGVNSINGSNEPLYVIDGVQIKGASGATQSGNNPLSTLNPSDIADMQILQGPAASALYGSSATNGVILITTKRGKSGEVRVNYGYQLTEQMPPKHLPVMNLQQYAQMQYEYKGLNNTPGEFLDPSLLGPGTDWQSELFRRSAMYKHNASISGGSEKLTYFLSGEYLNQQGVAQGSGFNRYGFRLNLDNKAFDWLTLGLNLNYSQIDEKVTTTSEGIISRALSTPSQIPVKNLDGTWGGGDNLNGASQWVPTNPLASVSLITDKDTKRQFTGGGNMQIDLMKGLFFRMELNTNLGTYNRIYYKPVYKIGWDVNTIAKFRDETSLNTWWGLLELLQYSKDIEKHHFDIMASHEAQSWTWKNLQGYREGYLTDNVFDLNAGDPNTATNSGGHGDGAKDSYMGRLNYNYAERYILFASIRTDGSSSFGANNRWGTFPAASVAWRISKEPWYHLDIMNEAKLRLEWGTTGNPGWGGIYSSMNSGPTQWGTGFVPGRYSNPNLKWESTTSYDFGFNFWFLKNKIQLEGDIYRKNTDNLIMDNPLPAYMGVQDMGSIGTPVVNIGALQNNGWQLSINTTNIATKEFTWTSNFNISKFKTTVTKLFSKNAQIYRGAWWMGNFQQVSQVGQAPWQFVGYIYDGLYQSLDDIDKSPVPVDNAGNRLKVDQYNGIWVGDVKFKDISGPKGVPDSIIDIHDQTTIGTPWPKLNGGFTNTFSYKGFDLNILLTYVYGNNIYNWVAMQNSKTNNVWSSGNLLLGAFDYARPVANSDGSVTLSNPNATIPRISDTDLNGNWNRFSTRWMEDGSFIRVKNVSLTYTLPKTLINRQKVIKDVRLTLSAQNLFTFTKYKGYDPEVGAYVGQNVYDNSQTIGVDGGHYPLTPIYTFTVNVNL